MTADVPVPDVATADSVRTRRRRIVIASVVGVVAVIVAGTVAAVGGGKSDHVRVAAGTSSTTTTADTSTTEPSTSTSSSTSTAPSSFPGTEPATTPGAVAPTTPAAVAQAQDLEGTLVLDRSTLVAGQPTGFTLTVSNVSNHVVTFDWQRSLGVWIDGYVTKITSSQESARYATTVGGDLQLATGEQRSFTATTTPIADLAGTSANVRATIIHVDGSLHLYYDTPEFVTGIPAVPVTIVPPGQVAGQPLDPSLGKWSATLSADATHVTPSGSLVVHATVRNTGDQVQDTSGYGSLAVGCTTPMGSWDPPAGLLDAAAIAPGAARTFTTELRPIGTFVGPPGTLGQVTCVVGLAFHGPSGHVEPHGIVGEPLTIPVLPDPPTTTPRSPITGTEGTT